MQGDWIIAKAELEQEHTLLTSEIKSLQEKLEVLTTINDGLIEREQTASLSAEGQDRILVLLTENSAKYEEMLLGLCQRLPPPLAKDIEDELGDAVMRDKRNIGARFQAIVSAINQIHRFNQKPFFTKEAYQAANGTAKQLDALYWGIAAGYRIDPSNSIAQIGSPKEDGWTWSDASTHAQSIREVLDIHQGNLTPTYINLPLQRQSSND